jgi:hypothetical protein
MKEQKGSGDETTRNRGLKHEEQRLRDPENRPPHSTTETDAAEPERPTTPQEGAEADVAHLENPPQAEGPRERSNEGV